jgi:hypothetical protein
MQYYGRCESCFRFSKHLQIASQMGEDLSRLIRFMVARFVDWLEWVDTNQTIGAEEEGNETHWIP